MDDETSTLLIAAIALTIFFIYSLLPNNKINVSNGKKDPHLVMFTGIIVLAFWGWFIARIIYVSIYGAEVY